MVLVKWLSAKFQVKFNLAFNGLATKAHAPEPKLTGQLDEPTDGN